MYTNKNMISLRQAFLDISNQGKHWLIQDKCIYFFGEVRPTNSRYSSAIIKALSHNDNLQLALIDTLDQTNPSDYTWKMLIPVKVNKNTWVTVCVICSGTSATINIYDPSNEFGTGNREAKIIEDVTIKALELYPWANFKCFITKGTQQYGLSLSDKVNSVYSGHHSFYLIAAMFNGCNINSHFNSLIKSLFIKSPKTTLLSNHTEKVTLTLEDDVSLKNKRLIYYGDAINGTPHGKGTLFMYSSSLKAKQPVVIGSFLKGRILNGSLVNTHYGTESIKKILTTYKALIQDLFDKQHVYANKSPSLLRDYDSNNYLKPTINESTTDSNKNPQHVVPRLSM